MFSDDILATIKETCLEKEIHAMEFDTYSDNVSYIITKHIIECEDNGTEPNILELKVPLYPRCTGEGVVRIGDIIN